MSIPTPISVLVVDDHDTLRRSIVSTLNNESGIAVIGEAKNGIEAIEQTKKLSPDVVVMDISMPLMDGLTAAKKITNLGLRVRVLIISQYEDENYIRKCMAAGAHGYLLKNSLSAELANGIQIVHDGGVFFTESIAQRILGLYLKELYQPAAR